VVSLHATSLQDRFAVKAGNIIGCCYKLKMIDSRTMASSKIGLAPWKKLERSLGNAIKLLPTLVAMIGIIPMISIILPQRSSIFRRRFFSLRADKMFRGYERQQREWTGKRDKRGDVVFLRAYSSSASSKSPCAIQLHSGKHWAFAGLATNVQVLRNCAR